VVKDEAGKKFSSPEAGGGGEMIKDYFLMTHSDSFRA
jgi:hypothetical protein